MVDDAAQHATPKPKPTPKPSAKPEVTVNPQPTPDPQATPQPSGKSYIEEMKSAGFDNLDVDQLIAMKIHGVTAQYVHDMVAAGVKVDVENVLSMRIQGVTPEYINQSATPATRPIRTRSSA